MKKENLKKEQIKITNIGNNNWYDSKGNLANEVIIK